MPEPCLLAFCRPGEAEAAAREISFLEGAPARGPRLAPASVLVGMAELARGGLSETWLLKACGHRHWLLLAELLGLREPDFRDAEGHKTYATFTAVAVREARLDRVQENDRLGIDGAIGRVSRTQFRSLQQVRVRGRNVAEVEMVSVFLRRRVAGRNRSVVRALPVSLQPHGLAADEGGLVGQAYAMRNGSWTEHRGFRRAEALASREFHADPCPQTDFNGADFLYFASFQAFVDRAEWSWFRHAEPLARTRRREIFYYGNIELGDTLRVELCGLRQTPSGFAHWCRIVRGSDGCPIAEAFSSRDQAVSAP